MKKAEKLAAPALSFFLSFYVNKIEKKKVKILFET